MRGALDEHLPQVAAPQRRPFVYGISHIIYGCKDYNNYKRITACMDIIIIQVILLYLHSESHSGREQLDSVLEVLIGQTHWLRRSLLVKAHKMCFLDVETFLLKQLSNSEVLTDLLSLNGRCTQR